MLDLMAVSQDDGPMPLYLHTVYRILRDMRIEEQEAGTRFDYQNFKFRLLSTAMTPGQLGPLNQRLDMLESFMPQMQVRPLSTLGKGKEKGNGKGVDGNDWTSMVCLTFTLLEIKL